MEHSSHLSHDAYMTRHAIMYFPYMHCVNYKKKFTRDQMNKCESRNSEHSWTFLLYLIVLKLFR